MSKLSWYIDRQTKHFTEYRVEHPSYLARGYVVTLSCDKKIVCTLSRFFLIYGLYELTYMDCCYFCGHLYNNKNRYCQNLRSKKAGLDIPKTCAIIHKNCTFCFFNNQSSGASHKLNFVAKLPYTYIYIYIYKQS